MKLKGFFIACLVCGLIGYEIGKSSRSADAPANEVVQTAEKLSVTTTQSSVEVHPVVNEKAASVASGVAAGTNKKMVSASNPPFEEEPNEVIEVDDEPATPEQVELLKKQEAESEPRLQKWLYERADKGFVITKTEVSKDGGYFSQERLDSGQIADREYGSTGALRSESMIEPDGNKISRSFFLNGQVKFLMFESKDGTRDMTSLDSSGFPVSKTVEYANGQRLVFEYDESGNVVRKVFIEKNKSGRIIE
ncbi:MAG: hypothetical protein JST80_12915 [Bdellovibrionales bacterium]|nr:hypothetical protein [Bdellovibrionales bacterium]